MDTKRMHEMIEKLSEAAECEFNKGIENVDTCEMDKVVGMMESLSEAMYYRTLTKAMQESDTEEIMDMFDRYGDDGKRYYDMWRYKSGRFAPKGRGTRRGYEEPPYYHMYPEREHMRDMDRDDRGKMYYSEPASNVSGSNNMSRSYSESNYDRAKRNYTETKELHKGNTQEDKEHKMKSLDGYMKELSTDITHLLGDMTAEEKNLLRTKLSTLVSKI